MSGPTYKAQFHRTSAFFVKIYFCFMPRFSPEAFIAPMITVATRMAVLDQKTPLCWFQRAPLIFCFLFGFVVALVALGLYSMVFLVQIVGWDSKIIGWFDYFVAVGGSPVLCPYFGLPELTPKSNFHFMVVCWCHLLCCLCSLYS